MARPSLAVPRLEDRLAPAGVVRPEPAAAGPEPPAPQTLDLSGPVRWGVGKYAIRGDRVGDTAGNGYVRPAGLTPAARTTDTDGTFAGFVLDWTAAVRAAFRV
ncbi:MAG TPA: hypothetical protein VM597_38270 [Gemmataceae bacterium]|jgi:hypothetical protein|nr:hypothetical protein [Gemmataceae bacterium]